MRLGPSFACAALAGWAIVTLAAPASAGTTKAACIAAFDLAQEARDEGALLRAREQLLVCSQQECPGMVRAECASLLRQVEDAQPTIVLKAADHAGLDLTDVAVELDGRKLATVLDGHAIPVDPGKLSLVFQRAPWAPVAVDIVIAEGEKNRIVRAILGPPAPPAVVTTKPPPATARRDVIGWAVPGGLALVGAGMLTFAGITRLRLGGEADDLRSTCAPRCPLSEQDRITGDLATANVALAIGIGSLALATITWFVLAPKAPARRALDGT